MKKSISIRIKENLLNQLRTLQKTTRLSRTALIEEGIDVIIQLYTSSINEDQIKKIANKLISKRENMYKRLAKK
ncbi:MAG: ribbon-helix-helix domain-containing protein [Candidatus Omnitrophota bacterium]|nr:MAG: ribbon-helix-helix domain-containing protein [Candidatus Omnitrophota bacterium]